MGAELRTSDSSEANGASGPPQRQLIGREDGGRLECVLESVPRVR